MGIFRGWINRRSRRGVVFIGVLLLVLLVAMFIGASFELGLWGQRREQHQVRVAAARRAARNGLAYCLARLDNQPDWRGASAFSQVVNEPDLKIFEDQGNIIGLLREEALTSQFRARFNYYDGSGGADNLDDPSQLRFAWTRICSNNLLGASAIEVPQALGPGASVLTPSSSFCQLPPGAIFLAVEGRSAGWLDEAWPATPNPVQPGGQSLSRCRIEAVYKVALPPQGSRAVAASAGDFSVSLPTAKPQNRVALSSSSSSRQPRIRSRGNLQISGGKSGKDNLVAGKQGGSYSALGSITGVQSSTAAAVPEGASDPLLGLTWPEIQKAVANPDPNVNQLPAGTYAVWQDGSLHYYDTNLTGYHSLMSSNPSDPGLVSPPLPSSLSYSFASGQAVFKVRANTLVAATATTSDLVVLPKVGLAAGPGISEPKFNPIPSLTDSLRARNITWEFSPQAGEAAVLTSPGEITLGAILKGDGGSLTAEGNINIVSLGVDFSAISNPKEGVSIYTKKNLLMSSFDDVGKDRYRRIALKGVVYAWGDVQFDLGHPSLAEKEWGDFDLTGAMVAYGKDPGDPSATALPAHIRLAARSVDLKYDESYIQVVRTQLSANPEFQRVRWHEY